MKKSSRFLPAVSWFLFISVLFFLPGSALPSDDWMSAISFDKWIHIGLFGILIYLWSRAINAKGKKAFLLIFSAIVYGYLVEVCQDQWVVNRSFDWGDLVADFIGSVAGIGLWTYTKK